MSTIYKLPSSKTRVVIRKRGIYKSASFDKASDAKSWTLETEAVIEANRHGIEKRARHARLGDLSDRISLEIVAELVAARHGLFASKSAKKASTIHGTIHRKP